MNLTETARIFKKAVVFVVAFIVIYYISILFVFPLARGIIKALIPEKDPANPMYGILDPLVFIEKPITGNPTYELNTPNATLPKLPNKMTVYKFKPIQFSYTAGQQARQDATSFGFSDSDLTTDLKGEVYKWRSLLTEGILEIDINTRKLIMNTVLIGKESFFPTVNLDRTTVIKNSIDLLLSIGRFNDVLYPSGYQNVKLGKFYGSKIVETTDPLEAQIARVDFFRSIGDYKILGADPNKGLLQVYVGSVPTKRDKEQITPAAYPKAEIYYWEVETQSEATYPIISISQAWEVVKGGGGIISGIVSKDKSSFEAYTTEGVDEILINNIYLAYYETAEHMNYLQPIYVFEGNYKKKGTAGGSITIYFPAVAGEYVKSSSSNTTNSE